MWLAGVAAKSQPTPRPPTHHITSVAQPHPSHTQPHPHRPREDPMTNDTTITTRTGPPTTTTATTPACATRARIGDLASVDRLPPCQRCGHYHQTTPDRCVGPVGLADEADTDPPGWNRCPRLRPGSQSGTQTVVAVRQRRPDLVRPMRRLGRTRHTLGSRPFGRRPVDLRRTRTPQLQPGRRCPQGQRAEAAAGRDLASDVDAMVTRW